MIKFTQPNFEMEWDEAVRYNRFNQMGKVKWLELVKTGYMSNYGKIKHVLYNVDLDFDKLESDKQLRFNNSFNDNYIEIPIVVQFNNGTYDLVGGNTRIAGLIKHNISNIPVWVIPY